MQWKFYLLALGFAFLTGQTTIIARAQEHVVPVDELRKDAERNAEKRHADEAAIRELLRSEAGKKALQAADVDSVSFG